MNTDFKMYAYEYILMKVHWMHR